ncbi:MAG: CBS and ACT domain-containing protein [Desulfocapsaceae bacterium]|nr:CBS and ACT domain-containing protein [Desulfocapsaceae bacterium]
MFVKLWMKENPVTVGPLQTIAEAIEIMSQFGIRRLPVLDNDKTLIGIITREDIIKAIPMQTDQDDAGTNSQSPVAAHMTSSPVTTDPMEPLEMAANTMRKNKIGSLPVVNANGTLIGIITEADIGRALMDILGVGKGGARIELQTGKTARELYETFEIFKDFDMTVSSVAVYPDFSETQQLLTIRVQGDDLDAMLDALWKSGCKVHRIMINDEDR